MINKKFSLPQGVIDKYSKEVDKEFKDLERHIRKAGGYLSVNRLKGMNIEEFIYILKTNKIKFNLS